MLDLDLDGDCITALSPVSTSEFFRGLGGRLLSESILGITALDSALLSDAILELQVIERQGESHSSAAVSTWHGFYPL